jgi:hypothetical protein
VRKFPWIMAVLVLVGCGGNPLGVQFDATVPGEQKALMQTDLGRLSSLSLPSPSSTDLYYLSLADGSSGSVTAWMQSRMRYVVGETFDYGSRAVKTTSALDPTQLGATQTVMMNLGSFLYLDVKGTGKQYTLQTSSGLIPISTPRVNIFQIGEGLFDANSIPTVELGAYSNSLLRMATYFHEGRHSDGNGANAGFPHSSCPSGKYAGKFACENNINGPYAIQTIFLRLASQTCTDCNSTEIAGLELSVADYASRQIGYQLPDPTPESYSGTFFGSVR